MGIRSDPSTSKLPQKIHEGAADVRGFRGGGGGAGRGLIGGLTLASARHDSRSLQLLQHVLDLVGRLVLLRRGGRGRGRRGCHGDVRRRGDGMAPPVMVLESDHTSLGFRV